MLPRAQGRARDEPMLGAAPVSNTWAAWGLQLQSPLSLGTQGPEARRNPLIPSLGHVSPPLLSPGGMVTELLEEPPTLSHPLRQWEPWDIFCCPSQVGWPIWERALSNDDSILPGEVSPPRQPSWVRVQFAFLQHRGKILSWVTQICSRPDVASLEAAEGRGTANHRAPKRGVPEEHQRRGLHGMLMPSVGRNRG